MGAVVAAVECSNSAVDAVTRVAIGGVVGQCVAGCADPDPVGDVVVGHVRPELVTGTEHIDAASATSDRTLVPVGDVPDHDVAVSAGRDGAISAGVDEKADS